MENTCDIISDEVAIRKTTRGGSVVMLTMLSAVKWCGIDAFGLICGQARSKDFMFNTGLPRCSNLLCLDSGIRIWMDILAEQSEICTKIKR